MSQQSVIRKYGLGLASTVKTEEEFALCLEQLQAFMISLLAMRKYILL